MPQQGNHKIFSTNSVSFGQEALDIFNYQLNNNAVYCDFVQALGIRTQDVREVKDIPFLPVRFFKTHPVVTGDFSPEAVFESSGTTGMVSSRHLVRDVKLYEESFSRGFSVFYGDITDYCVIGLLPSYLERGHSSLVYMVDRLISQSGHPESGFYLDEYAKLASVLQSLEERGQPVLLIGVSFALLDFAELYPMTLKHTIIMETGGMKGRRKELIRQELHAILKSAFNQSSIHSEYGMTELLSQAYSRGKGIFECANTLKIVVRESTDPMEILPPGRHGLINAIDLGNLDSCAFIATDDVGIVYPDGSFKVLGRMDGADVRGCNLMVV